MNLDGPGFLGKLRAREGFTSTEILVASAVMAIIATAVLMFSTFAGRSFAAMTNYVELDARSRNALDVMIREVRQAQALTYYTNNMIKLTGVTNQELVYAWDKAKGELRRAVNGVWDTRPLLTGCEILNFKIYQRTPSLNHEFYETATNVAQAKMINVSWLCSRSVLGKKINTESVQTTKIVIRNQKVLY